MIERAKSAIRTILPQNTFARGVSVLVGGTMSSQVLLVLAAPLLARLYTPDDFGLLAVYGGLLALIGVVSGLRYELAIALPEDDVEAANVSALGLCLVALTTALSVALVALLAKPIADLFGVSVLTDYLWLLPVGVLFAGGYNVSSYWFIRTKRYGTIAETKIRQAFATLVVQLVGFQLGGLALLLGQVTGQSVGAARLTRPLLVMPAFRQVSWRGMWQAAKRYRRFPLFSTWGGVLNTAGSQLPPLLFAALFSTAAAGLYALANRVLNLPMALIGGAIGQVFFSNAAEARRKGNLGQLVEQLHAKLAHIGFPPAFLLILIGPDIFAFIFGENWQQAGEFARWMAPWLYLQFVSSPLSIVLFVTENQKQGLMFQIIMLIFRAGAILVGFATGDLLLTIVFFSGVSALCYLGLALWIYHIVGNHLRDMLMQTLSAVGAALVCAAPVIISLGFPEVLPNLWLYALAVSLLLIGGHYWLLASRAY